MGGIFCVYLFSQKVWWVTCRVILSCILIATLGFRVICCWLWCVYYSIPKDGVVLDLTGCWIETGVTIWCNHCRRICTIERRLLFDMRFATVIHNKSRQLKNMQTCRVGEHRAHTYIHVCVDAVRVEARVVPHTPNHNAGNTNEADSCLLRVCRVMHDGRWDGCSCCGDSPQKAQWFAWSGSCLWKDHRQDRHGLFWGLGPLWELSKVLRERITGISEQHPEGEVCVNCSMYTYCNICNSSQDWSPRRPRITVTGFHSGVPVFRFLPALLTNQLLALTKMPAHSLSPLRDEQVPVI